LGFLGILVHLFVRHVLYKIFAKFTVHRGIFHSQVAAIFFLFLSAAAAYHLFGLATVTAWLVGCFVALGYMIHLLLDQIYSVDITGAGIKESFGTRRKLASVEEFKTSVARGVATAAVFFVATPGLSDFTHAIGNQKTYASLHERFLPKDRWFNIPYRRAENASQGGDRSDDTLTTGSVSGGKSK